MLLAAPGCEPPPTGDTEEMQAPRDFESPLSVDEALSFFQIEEGLRIDAVASEPLTVDPVAFAFDERGRLYVVEHRGYPDPISADAEATHHGRIALLEDTNGDGKFDHRHEFATGLTYPNGIMVWRGGVFVTCAPDLLYLRDNTGDGIADEKRVVLTGFNTTQTTQIRFSHPTLALDGWVYLTSGLNGGSVTAPDHPERATVKFTRSDTRFHPDTFVFETVGGRGQYGLTFDDYGRRFICSNRHPVMHVLMDLRDIARNSDLRATRHVHHVSTVGDEAIVYPISADTTTASYIPAFMSRPHAGTFTAASGVYMHRGDALPMEHYGNAFICESAQNLVQRQVVKPSGPTFRSMPARDGVEFLASRDTWFRPVFLGGGPDGALYVADMYREEIDHPQYMPAGIRDELDFDAGKDRGRIYRIASDDRPPASYRSATGQFHDPGNAGLVHLLAEPNAWTRETAHRLLLERGPEEEEVVALLRDASGSSGNSLQRLHSLRLLQSFDKLADEDIVAALADEDPGVAENAVALARDRLVESTNLLERILELSNHSSSRVRFTVALALGDADDESIFPALARIAAVDGADPWTRLAIMSSIGNAPNTFLESFLALTEPEPSGENKSAILEDLAEMFGTGRPHDDCRRLLAEILIEKDAPFAYRAAAAAGMAQGLRRRGVGDENLPPLIALLETNGHPALDLLLGLFDEAVRMLESDATGSRSIAIRLLGHAPREKSLPPLLALTAPGVPSELQIEALRSLFQIPGAADHLFEKERWAGFTPAVRQMALDTALTRPAHLEALLTAIEEGDVSGRSLNSQMRNRLRRHRNPAIRERAVSILETIESGDRMAVFEEWKSVLELSANPAAGRGVFQKTCAACHTFRGAGHPIGPDLSGIQNQPPETILLHTLLPEFEITPGYEAYLIETLEGNTFFGLIAGESDTHITLRTLAGDEQRIARDKIAGIAVSPASLMPDGLEQQTTRQEMADLLAYLRSPPGDR